MSLRRFVPRVDAKAMRKYVPKVDTKWADRVRIGVPSIPTMNDFPLLEAQLRRISKHFKRLF